MAEALRKAELIDAVQERGMHAEIRWAERTSYQRLADQID